MFYISGEYPFRRLFYLPCLKESAGLKFTKPVVARRVTIKVTWERIGVNQGANCSCN